MLGKRQIVGGEKYLKKNLFFYEKVSHLFRYPRLVTISLENLSKKMFS